MDRLPLSLSNEFQDVLNMLEYSNASYFITGRAGTGKSTLLQLFRETSRKRIAVLAPTGIAALNVKGQTIHSFFGFPPKMVPTEELGKRKNHRLYKNMDTLIIDEISMVRADMIDNIDIFLRNNRENDLPFGGVQLLMFGDLFQLPPVVATAFEKEYFRTTYESQYFFSSHVVKSDDFHYEMIELNQVYRQEERYFINMLDAIRLNHIDYDELEVLNERYQAVPEDTKYLLTLTSINATANNINNQEVNKLEGESFTYLAKLSGQFNERNAPADPVLKLKKGAQVMFVKNDPQKQFVNGTIGIINDIGHDYIKVMVEDNSGYEVEIDVGIQDWEIIKYELDREKNNEITANVVGVFSQYPIKLAWAITIHKSQGKTFDKINIDLGRGAFEHGQTYVALSRCKTLGGIFLNQALRPRDILVDERVREYYQMMR